MKKWLSYTFYFVVTIAVTYAFQWILVLFMESVRFTAAGRPPGDIGLGLKLIFSGVVPLFYSIFLTFVFFLYRSLLKQFGIELTTIVPIIFNIFTALYLIVRFTFAVFDFSF